MKSQDQPKGPLKVLLVSTSYPADLRDWRGLFIRHLTWALADRRDLKLRLWCPPGEFPENSQYAADPAEVRWLTKLMKAGGIAHLMRTRRVGGLGAPAQLLWMLRALYRRESEVDIYHVNWLQNTLTLPRNDRPLLTTVLGTDMQLLRLPGMKWLLRRAFRGRRVAICPNAQWMLPELERCFSDSAIVRFLPFGIEPHWFGVERKLELPCKWICVSRLTRGKIGKLFDWCEPFFSHGTRELHLFGPMQQLMLVPSWVHYHGPTTPDSLRREWFPRVNGLISLSEHSEGRPQVMLEAMAAGLPIIASGLPAHEDLLHHKDTGWICHGRDDLFEGLTLLEQESENHALGIRAREWVQTHVGTWAECAKRYAELYGDLTATPNADLRHKP